jgi:glycosyltransferase involved in cell wall biosynthesis
MTPVQHLNLHMADTDHSNTKRWTRYFLPVDSFSKDLPVPILGIMLLIWQIRDADLQITFPLTTTESKIDFLCWCASHGSREYKALQEATIFSEKLSEKADLKINLAPTDAGHVISNYMLLIKKSRKDLPYDLMLVDGRAQFLRWYLAHGHFEMNLEKDLLEWQVEYLNSPSEISGINRLQLIVYLSRHDLKASFSLPEMNRQFIDWFNSNFLFTPICSQSDLDRGFNEYPEKRVLLKGVNVIGYAFGQLGIGEDARMATKALAGANIETVLINFPPGSNIPQNDRSMEDFVRDTGVFDTNIFCLTALETGRNFAEWGSSQYADRFNIGYWPWELEEWPKEWGHLFSLIDEAWASSMHTYRSIFSDSPVPVKHVPMAVTIPQESDLTRENFSLPVDTKLFIFGFDLNSAAKRKNPSACVEAFLLAFPQGATDQIDVGLVIKIHPPTGFNPEWEKLLELKKTDSRIHIIESTLTKEDLLALYRTCDCFISLHRAEGFGRNIAECMLLGIPVITTAYSGNLDYTNNQNSYLVPYQMAPLNEKDYPFGGGKFWANPNINAAASMMRLVIENSKTARLISQRAKNQIASQYNLRTVGLRYRFELNNR